MPELPEVETTRCGLEPHLVCATIKDVVIRNASLRWPIPGNLPKLLRGQTILSLKRRAKYLLADCGDGTLILHLGMSGSLRILPANTPVEKHDHFDLVLDNGKLMRLRDPRRFGAVLWYEGDVNTHPLLARLGPEPLDNNETSLPPYRGGEQSEGATRMGVAARSAVPTPTPTLPLHGGGSNASACDHSFSSTFFSPAHPSMPQ